MSESPRVSVVMSVFNGERDVCPSIDSILEQEGVDLELVLIDDGSTDATATIVDQYARDDSRVRVIHQDNQGLTRALIRGCQMARGDFIARQDAGDRSLPRRLARQVRTLDQIPTCALVSCYTRFVAPGGEHLYTVRLEGADIRRSLLEDGPEQIYGIAGHGSAMFRREAYERVGGYRDPFYVAQDLDLWARLAGVGEIGVVPEALYEVKFAPAEISARHRELQIAMKRLIVALRDLPPETHGEILEQARALKPSNASGDDARTRADGLYFIARCLQEQGDPAAQRYLREAIAANPLHVKAWLSRLRLKS